MSVYCNNGITVIAWLSSESNMFSDYVTELWSCDWQGATHLLAINVCKKLDLVGILCVYRCKQP